MDLQTRKQKLLEYILTQMNEDEIKRGLGMDDEVMGFTSYQEFVQYQTGVVNQFNETSVGTMEFLRDQIVPASKLLDKEDMGTWGNDGFCFDKTGAIVFFHDR